MPIADRTSVGFPHAARALAAIAAVRVADTHDTLHIWAQIVGKLKVECARSSISSGTPPSTSPRAV